MSHTEFFDAVRRAIADEMEAARMYTQLAGIAPSEALGARIRCFAMEERRHSRQLARLLPEGCPGGEGSDVWAWEEGGNLGIEAEASWCPKPPLPPGQPGPCPPSPQLPTPPTSFAAGVAMAIEGEIHAIEEYSQLATLAPDACVRETILCIQKDEMYHLISFECIQSMIQ